MQMSVAAKGGVESIKITSCKFLTVHTVRGVSLNPEHAAAASNGRATNEDQTTTAELHRRARTESWYSSSSKAKKNVIAPQTTTHHDIRVYFTNETRFVGIV